MRIQHVKKKEPTKQWKISMLPNRHYMNAMCSVLVLDFIDQTGGQKDEISSDIRLCGCGWIPLSCQCTTAFPLSFIFSFPHRLKPKAREKLVTLHSVMREMCVCVCVHARVFLCAWKQDESKRQGEREKLFSILGLRILLCSWKVNLGWKKGNRTCRKSTRSVWDWSECSINSD